MSLVPTLTIDALEVNFSAVNPEIQAFISDIMYRIYYSPDSEIRNMASGNGSLSPNSIIDLIILVFEQSKEEILLYYPNLLNATMLIDDYFISQNILQINSQIVVDTINPQIYEKVQVEIRF